MLHQRLLTSAIGLPILFGLLWLNAYLRWHGSPDDLPVLALVILIAGASGLEVSRVIQHRYDGASRWNGMYAAVIIPFLVHMIRMADMGGTWSPVTSLGLLIDSLGVTAAVMFLFLGVWTDVERRKWDGIRENAVNLLAGAYIGGAVSTLLVMTQMPWHELTLVLVFGLVFSLDTAAYFGGKMLRGPRLAPAISPQKTYAGALVGLLSAVLLAVGARFVPLALGYPAFALHMTWWHFAILGVAIGLAGEAGDLLESAFKRWGGVKDTGSAIPGHGGFLDRFDSLFLAAPICYLVLLLL